MSITTYVISEKSEDISIFHLEKLSMSIATYIFREKLEQDQYFSFEKNHFMRVCNVNYACANQIICLFNLIRENNFCL